MLTTEKENALKDLETKLQDAEKLEQKLKSTITSQEKEREDLMERLRVEREETLDALKREKEAEKNAIVVEMKKQRKIAAEKMKTKVEEMLKEKEATFGREMGILKAELDSVVKDKEDNVQRDEEE